MGILPPSSQDNSFDVTTRIEGLDSGRYKVNVYVHGDLHVSGEVEIP